MKTVKFISCLIILGLLSVVFVPSAFASFIYLDPPGGNMQQGVVFPVQVRLSAQNEQISSTSVYLNYPAEKVEVAYIKHSNAFPVEVGQSYGNGTIAVTRQNANWVSGDQNIITIGFKPKVSNDTVSVNFTDGTRASLANNTDTLDIGLTKLRGGNYNIIQGAGSVAGVAAQGGPMDELPKAGMPETTYLIFGTALGLIAVGAFVLRKN